MPSTVFSAWVLLLAVAVVRVDSQDQQQFADDLLPYYAPPSSLSAAAERYVPGGMQDSLDRESLAGRPESQNSLGRDPLSKGNKLVELFSQDDRQGDDITSTLTGNGPLSRNNYRDDDNDGDDDSEDDSADGNEGRVSVRGGFLGTGFGESRSPAGGSFTALAKRSSLAKRLKSLKQNVREHYMRMFAPSKANLMGTKELKRERHIGTTLSVESPMDLIRQRLMQELHRREMVQKQRQIQTNDELLSSIGKRSMRQALASSSVLTR